MDPQHFNIEVTWNKERRGMMCSPELHGNPQPNGCIEVATPPPFNKGIAGIWSPEHLFTASVASCFMTTFLAIAENSKLNFSAFSCKAEGRMEEENGKLRMSVVVIKPTVTISTPADRDRTAKILMKTENACLITNSINAKVEMSPEINVA